MEAAIADVVLRMRAERVRPILLKGPAIARWLYRESEVRPSSDVDLLVSPADFPAAEQVLEAMGLTRFPVAGLEHADTWLDEDRPLAVELHWSLLGVDTGPERAWQVLSHGTEVMDVGGVDVEALGFPARTMHLALHVAQHGSDRKPLNDLLRAIEQLPDASWVTALAVAEELDAVEGFAAGLRLLPEGSRVAERLSLPRDASAQTVLMTENPPPLAMGLARIAGAGARARRCACCCANSSPSPRTCASGHRWPAGVAPASP